MVSRCLKKNKRQTNKLFRYRILGRPFAKLPFRYAEYFQNVSRRALKCAVRFFILMRMAHAGKFCKSYPAMSQTLFFNKKTLVLSFDYYMSHKSFERSQLAILISKSPFESTRIIFLHKGAQKKHLGKSSKNFSFIL